MSEPSTGMNSGSDAGAPGDSLPDRDPVSDEPDAAAPELQVERAVEDDAPLPAEGGPQGDGLEVEFREPS